MKRLFNFTCQSGQVFERYCCDKITVTLCTCGKEAKRALSTPRYLSNSTGKSPARH